MSRHEGVSCDSCSASNFAGRRFKCLVCSDYDLCSVCYDQDRHSHPHHPMQCLLNKKDHLVYFGETSKSKCQSLTCPVCGCLGFTLETLLTHARALHSDQHDRVLCPVCVSSRHSLHPAATQDLASHLQREHSFGTGVRDIVALLEEPTAGGLMFNRRNNVQLRFPDSLLDSSTTFSSPTAQSVESVRPFNQLLSQISNRCNEIGPVMIPRSMSRSHSKISHGARNRDKCINSDAPPPPSSKSSDDSDRFVSKGMRVIGNHYPDSVTRADQTQFVQEIILSSLAPHRESCVLPGEWRLGSLEPPTPPPCLGAASVRLPRCVERECGEEAAPAQRRKRSKKGPESRNKKSK